jgi:glycosyltransferase involved in cell wall biosynthesis
MLAYAYYEIDNRIIRYAETLARRGDIVDVVCIGRPGAPRKIEINGVGVFRLQNRRRDERGRLSYLLRMISFFLRSMYWLWFRSGMAYDVIHVHNVPDFLVFAAWLPKWKGAGVILDIHDLLPEFYCSKFNAAETHWTFRSLLLVERCAVRFADRVIVSNDLWKDKLARRCNAQHKATALPNYVDLSLFQKTERTRHDSRWIIVYAGGLQAHQGLSLVIEALPTVRKAIPTAQLHIYGEGPDEDDLRRRAVVLGLADCVFFHSPIPIQEIPAVLANADVGVVPKLANSFGNQAYSTKVMELMSQDVPVVIAATEVDLHYFPTTAVCFFDPGNAHALAQALLRVHRGCGYREELARHAREYVTANNWGQKATTYLEMVDSLGVRGHR